MNAVIWFRVRPDAKSPTAVSSAANRLDIDLSPRWREYWISQRNARLVRRSGRTSIGTW